MCKLQSPHRSTAGLPGSESPTRWASFNAHPNRMLKNTGGSLLHAASPDFTGEGADVPQALALVFVLHEGRGPRSARPTVQWKNSTTSGDQKTA